MLQYFLLICVLGPWQTVDRIVPLPVAFEGTAVSDGKSSPEQKWAPVAGPPRRLAPRETDNLVAATRLLSYVRFFHPSDQCVGVVDWDRFALMLLERAEPAPDAADLAQRLSEAIAPIAPTVQVWAGSSQNAAPRPAPPAGATELLSWKHLGAGKTGSNRPDNVYRSEVERTEIGQGAIDSTRTSVVKELGGGVCCRLPWKVYADAAGTLPHGKTPENWTSASGKPELTARDRSVRLAGVALAWGILQHFYPYFDVVETDWETALPTALEKASQDPDEASFLFTLRELVAKLHDGHGHVSSENSPGRTYLPLALSWVGSELAVIATNDAAAKAGVQRGDVVVTIDGRSADDCYRTVTPWISAATEGWRRTASIVQLSVYMPTADPARLDFRRPDGSIYSAALPRIHGQPMSGKLKTPPNGTAVAPGIVYFDLNGANEEELNRLLEKLVAAPGVIFDLRGYPGDAAIPLMEYLIQSPAESARWIIPLVRKPDREGVQWQPQQRWQLTPRSPRIAGKIAFLTGGGAISYAESIMSIVEHYKLAEIVGEATAGTNGNVNPFSLPGGFQVSWTGMIVLKHDGSRHHGVGISPTVRIVPTPAGIASGKDEVLDKAVEVLRERLKNNTAP